MRLRLPFLFMEECDQPGEFLRGDFEGRHALIRTAVADDHTILSPATSLATNLERVKVGAGFPSTGVATVAESAVLGKERLPALDDRR